MCSWGKCTTVSLQAETKRGKKYKLLEKQQMLKKYCFL